MAFPGIRVSLTDRSFFANSFSRFRVALLGTAERGAFDELIAAPTIQEFVAQFGRPIAGSYLADAVGYIGQSSDGCQVMRVGAQYASVTDAVASGTEGTYTVLTGESAMFEANQYVRVRQEGKATTSNARIDSVSAGTIALVSTGAEAVALADTYQAAIVEASDVANAATEAEAFLYSPSWTPVAAVGTATGDKNAYQITVTGDETAIVAGDVLLIEQANKSSTREIRVSKVLSNKVIKFSVTNDTETGYQSLGLQDAYTGATISKLVSYTAEIGLCLRASSAGTWANASGTRGLRVQVSPGSDPDTKKLLVYLDGSLVETVDNLDNDSNSDNYLTTRINAVSQYVSVSANTSDQPPTNTYNPWNLVSYSRVNYTTFSGGFNGENVTSADIIGSINPATEVPTGLKALEDPLVTNVDFICVPGNSAIGVWQEIIRICNIIHAAGIGDIPDNLNARAAIDWTNGQGAYVANGRIDSFRMAAIWNWWTGTDLFTGEAKKLPPSIGWLRTLARTFDQDKPWFAAAGVVRGNLSEATAVTYKYVQPAVREAMYGNGNVVNPIIWDRGAIQIWGDLTMKRTNSKLQELHNVVLVNYILANFSTIARKFVFDPIDITLYGQLKTEFDNFLQSVKSERGLEDYSLIIDASNNSAATRNERRVQVDLSIIPISAAQNIDLDLVVEESGATLVGAA